MRVFFLISFGFVLYTYAGYPLLIAALAYFKRSPWRQHVIPLSASVILPVHNGMALLPAKVESLRQMPPDLIYEIIVVLDGSDEEAERWLKLLDDPRVRVAKLPNQQGKSAALRRGMEVATSDLLLFIDIRPDITADSVRQLITNFADPQVGCVAGELHVEAIDGETSADGGLYWRYEQWIRNSESAYNSPVGVYGGFYAVRRSLATPPKNGLILDDMFQPLWIIRQGYRSVVDQHAIVVDRWPTTHAGEFQRKVRTLAGNFQLFAEEPWILTPHNPVMLQLVSHKLLRLAVPYCLIAMLLSSIAMANHHSHLWLAVALLQIGVILLGVFGNHMRIPLLNRISAGASALLLLNAAAVWALWIYISTPGPLWKIWKPTPSPAQSRTT